MPPPPCLLGTWCLGGGAPESFLPSLSAEKLSQEAAARSKCKIPPKLTLHNHLITPPAKQKQNEAQYTPPPQIASSFSCLHFFTSFSDSLDKNSPTPMLGYLLLERGCSTTLYLATPLESACSETLLVLSLLRGVLPFPGKAFRSAKFPKALRTPWAVKDPARLSSLCQEFVWNESQQIPYWPRNLGSWEILLRLGRLNQFSTPLLKERGLQRWLVIHSRKVSFLVSYFTCWKQPVPIRK